LFIGIAIIGLGILALVSELKKEKTKSYIAEVINCVEIFDNNMRTSRKRYEVSLRIESDYGDTYRTIQNNENLPIGRMCSVHLDTQTNKVEFDVGQRKNNIIGGLLAIVFGVIWCLISGVVLMPDLGVLFGKVCGYLLAISFICAAFYNLVIVRKKNEKDKIHDYKVKGSVIDSTSHISYSGSRNNRVYCPIYEFRYNGEPHTISSSVSSNIKSHYQIGREVDIVINKKTGKIYCEQDVKSFDIFYVIMGLAGVIGLGVLLLLELS